MSGARIAFAGLSPLCEDILRAALLSRPDIELVAPWTRLCAFASRDEETARELLVVELDQPVLPPTLRALLAAAKRLRVIALAPDARSATIFGLVESRTVLFDCSAEELWTALDSDL